MIQNRKFERAAQSRRQLAFCVAVMLHLAVFAAIAYQSDITELLPDFVKNLLGQPAEAPPTAAIP